MTPEDRAKLDNLYELTRENNTILRSLQRTSRLRTILRVSYWIIIIGLALGAFYFIQPFVEQLRDVSEQFRGLIQ